MESGAKESMLIGRFCKTCGREFGPTTSTCPDDNTAIESVTGTSLSEMLQTQDRLEPVQVVRIFLQVCVATNQFHKKRIIHGHLTPSDIYASCRKDECCRVKLTGFGTAGAEESGKAAEDLYKSPEQWAGKAPDARSDIYALGCIMYQSLTGRPPVEADALQDVMRDQSGREFSTNKSICETAEASSALESVVFKALRMDRDERYRTASEVEQDLKLTPEFGKISTAELPPEPLSNLSKRLSDAARSTWTKVALGVVAIVALFSLTGRWYTSTDKGSLELAKAALAVHEKSVPPDSPSLLDRLDKLVTLETKLGNIGDAAAHMKRIVPILEKRYSPVSSQVQEAHLRLVDLYLRAGNNQAAADECEKYTKTAVELYGSKSKEAADAYDQLANIYGRIPGAHDKEMDCYAKAISALQNLCQASEGEQRAKETAKLYERLYKDCLNLFQPVEELQDIKRLKVLAKCEEKVGEFGTDAAAFAAARGYYNKIIDLVKKTSPVDYKELANVTVRLADIARLEGDSEEAEQLYKQALNLCLQPNGVPNNATEDVKTAIESTAVWYRQQHKYSHVHELYEALRPVVQKRYGPRSAPLGLNSLQIADCYLLQMNEKDQRSKGRAELGKKAEPFYKEALPILEKENGKNDRGNAHLLNGLADCQRSQAMFNEGKAAQIKYAEALENYKRAAEVAEKFGEEEHGLYATALAGAAISARFANRFDESLKLYTRILEFNKKTRPADKLGQASCMKSVAVSEFLAGKDADARRHLQEILDLYPAADAKERASLMEVYNEATGNLRKWGKSAEADAFRASVSRVQKQVEP